MSRLQIVSLVVLLATCAAAVPHAQSQSVSVGFRNGVVRSTVEGNLFHHSLSLIGGRVRKGFRTGLHVTGSLSVPLSDRFALQGELQYAQKGASVHGTRVNEICGGPPGSCIYRSLNGTYRMSYIQLPVLLAWHYPLWRGLGLRLLAGPSLNLGLEPRFTTASIPNSALREKVLTPNQNSGFGVVGGLGLQFDMPSAGAVRIEARYHPAVTKMTMIGSEATPRSRAYAFSFGYAFPL